MEPLEAERIHQRQPVVGWQRPRPPGRDFSPARLAAIVRDAAIAGRAERGEPALPHRSRAGARMQEDDGRPAAPGVFVPDARTWNGGNHRVLFWTNGR